MSKGLSLDNLIADTAETFFYVLYDGLEIRLSSEDFLPDLIFEGVTDFKKLFFDIFREFTVPDDRYKWDYVEDSPDIGQYVALEIYDYIKAAVFQMKTGKRYWGSQAVLSLVSSYEFRSRFEGEIVLKGGDPRLLRVGEYLSGVENFVTRNAEDDMREAYLLLFNSTDKEGYDAAWKVVEDLVKKDISGGQSIAAVRTSKEYRDLKENQTVKGRLLPDVLG